MADIQAELTSRQRRAIAALISSRNISQAAAVARVGERTLYRWLADPTFQRMLQAQESEMIDQATRRLVGLQKDAIDALQNTINDSQTGAAVRVRASQVVLEQLMKLRELRNMEERLSALEAAVNDRQNNP